MPYIESPLHYNQGLCVLGWGKLMEFSTKGYSRVEQILLWTARLALLILLPFLFINYDEFKHYYFPIALVFFGTQIVADANNCLSFDFTVGQKEIKKINFKFSALSTIPKISINGIRVN